MRTLSMVIVACLLLAVAWYAFRAPQAIETASSTGATAADMPAAPPGVDADAREAPPSGVRTKRQILREYWGDRWAELEAGFEARMKDLDSPCPGFPTWESVAAKFERLLPMQDKERASIMAGEIRWPEELSVPALEEALPFDLPDDMTGVELGVLESIAQPFNFDLQDRALRYVDRIDGILKTQFRQGDFVKAPFSSVGIRQPAGRRFFYSTSRAGDGWGMSMGISLAEHPELVGLQDEMKSIRLARDTELQSYVKSL